MTRNQMKDNIFLHVPIILLLFEGYKLFIIKEIINIKLYLNIYKMVSFA